MDDHLKTDYNKGDIPIVIPALDDPVEKKIKRNRQEKSSKGFDKHKMQFVCLHFHF